MSLKQCLIELNGLMTQQTVVNLRVVVPVATKSCVLLFDCGNGTVIGNISIMVVFQRKGVCDAQMIGDVFAVAHDHLLAHEATMQVHKDDGVSNVFDVSFVVGVMVLRNVNLEVGFRIELNGAKLALEGASIHPKVRVDVNGLKAK